MNIYCQLRPFWEAYDPSQFTPDNLVQHGECFKSGDGGGGGDGSTTDQVQWIKLIGFKFPFYDRTISEIGISQKGNKKKIAANAFFVNSQPEKCRKQRVSI